MFSNSSVYNKFIKVFYAALKDLLAQSGLDRMFKAQQIWINYVHYILVPYFNVRYGKKQPTASKFEYLRRKRS